MERLLHVQCSAFGSAGTGIVWFASHQPDNSQDVRNDAEVNVHVVPGHLCSLREIALTQTFSRQLQDSGTLFLSGLDAGLMEPLDCIGPGR